MAEDQTRIQELIAGLMPQEQPSLGKKLLSAIPEAIAAYLNPQVLQQQLENKQTIQEREKERRSRINQLGAQLQIEDIISRGKERRAEEASIRAEGRAEERQESAESRADLRDLAKFNRESGFQEKLVNLNAEKNKELATINQLHRLQESEFNRDAQVTLEKLRSSNNITEQKIGGELSFIRPLVYSGFFTGKSASEIYGKILRDEKLSSQEEKQIRKAYDSMRNEEFRNRLQIANAGRDGRKGILEQGTEWAMNSAKTNELGLDASGQIRELRSNPLTGDMLLPDGSSPKKILNEDEQFRYYYNYWAKTQGVAPGETGTDIPDEKSVSISIDQAIQEARNEKRSDAEIAARLNDPQVQARLRATPQQIQDAITRNKVSGGSVAQLPAMAGATAESQAVSGISQAPGVREASRGEIEAEVARTMAKAGAASIIRDLTERLEEKAKMLNNKSLSENKALPNFKKSIQADIADLKSRLEYAYSQHPELRPK